MKSMYEAIKEKGPHIGIGHPGESSADFFRVEYQMNHMLQQSALPQVSPCLPASVSRPLHQSCTAREGLALQCDSKHQSAPVELPRAVS